jgi:hypothetical protein
MVIIGISLFFNKHVNYTLYGSKVIQTLTILLQEIKTNVYKEPT